MRSLAVATLMSVLLPCGLSSHAARADVKITVSFTEIQHEVFPRYVTHRIEGKLEIVLTSDGRIKTALDFGGRLGGGYAQLGRSSSGQSGTSTWHIVKGNLVKVYETESYIGTSTIKTNGVDSCNFTTRYTLRKGYDVFIRRRVSNREEVQLDDMHDENIVCTIENIRP